MSEPTEDESESADESSGEPDVSDSSEASTLAHDGSGVSEKPASDGSLEKSSALIEQGTVTERPGDTIGPYKLLQQIGEGGCGVVYMAGQRKPIKRKVALKIIKPGMDTKEVIARFEAERQALALMDHPNIAKVLDAGTTETGRPFFAMELVKGVPITEYCDTQQLNIRRRLELFRDICHAVQHAHQKGIIHRDLKPSNIMVTLHDTKPVVKVIDFGVAKAISQELTDRTLFTAYGQMIGTPQYMSPEQSEMSGLDIDTRSDIYSLGVVLYELLTGRTPLDANELRKAGLNEISRMIREDEVSKPSTKLSLLSNEEVTTLSRSHNEAPEKLNRLIRGDLDWIVMKTLEKDRGRRYETVNGFSEDIRRYLDNESVLASPPTVGYRLGKFARRNKTVLVTSGLIFASLIAALSVSIWQTKLARQAREAEAAQRELAEASAIDAITKGKEAEQSAIKAIKSKNEAEKARKDAQELVAFLGIRMLRNLNLRGNTPALLEVIEKMDSYYRAITPENLTRSEIDSHISALVQGGYKAIYYGDLEAADDYSDRALSLIKQVNLDFTNHRFSTAIRLRVSFLDIKDDSDKHEKILALLDTGIEKSSPRNKIRLLSRKGAFLRSEEKLEEALSNYILAAEMAEGFIEIENASSEDNFTFLSELNHTYGEIGNVLVNLGRKKEASEYLLRAIQGGREQLRQKPDHAGIMEVLVRVLGHLGHILLDDGKNEEALITFREQEGVAKAILTLKPDSITHQWVLITAKIIVAKFDTNLEVAKKINLYEQALEAFKTLPENDSLYGFDKDGRSDDRARWEQELKVLKTTREKPIQKEAASNR